MDANIEYEVDQVYCIVIRRLQTLSDWGVIDIAWVVVHSETRYLNLQDKINYFLNGQSANIVQSKLAITITNFGYNKDLFIMKIFS